MKLCSLVDGYQHFRATRCPLFQGQRDQGKDATKLHRQDDFKLVNRNCRWGTGRTPLSRSTGEIEWNYEKLCFSSSANKLVFIYKITQCHTTPLSDPNVAGTSEQFSCNATKKLSIIYESKHKQSCTNTQKCIKAHTVVHILEIPREPHKFNDQKVTSS